MRPNRKTRQAARIRVIAIAGLASSLLFILASAGCENPLVKEAVKRRDTTISPKMSVAVEGGAALPNAGAYDFGEVGVSDTAELRLVVSNTGPSALSIEFPAIGISEPFSFGSPLPTSIAPSGSGTFSVKFIPGSVGNKSITIQLATNDTANQLYTLTITGIGIDQVPAPVFTDGNFQCYPLPDDPPNIMITCDNPQAKIYYTTNGNDPSVDTVGAGTALYPNVGIAMTAITSTVYIKAKAVLDGYKDSVVVTATISNNDVKRPVITPLSSNTFYPEDAFPPITITSPTAAARIYYTTDGRMPSSFDYDGYFKSGLSLTYSGPHTGGSFTLRAVAFITNAPESAEATPVTYIFKMSKPVFSTVQPLETPQDTYYATEQTVTLSCAISGSIRYALDSSTLNGATGTPYSPILVPVGAAGSSTLTTVRAIAYKADWQDSDIISGDFGVCGPGRWSEGTNNSKWDQATWQ